MLLQDARNDVLALADAQDKGMWQPPEPAKMHLPGPGGRLVMEQQMENLVLAGKISEHDAIVGGKLAYILCGGECSPLQEMSEQDVLDLEREAFLSLCGMPKTQERMQFMLQTGKPLRN